MTRQPQDCPAAPSEMARAAFVDRFGGVFEHSAWIAERAHDAGLGSAHNTATGLHGALANEFRTASPDERLGVLNAHPDPPREKSGKTIRAFAACVLGERCRF